MSITNSTLERRKPMPKGKGLAPGKPIQRKSRLKSGAPPRATGRPSKRFAARRSPEYCAWIRTLPCATAQPGSIVSCAGRIECAHVVSRGAGGNDHGNVVPLCTRHHRRQHQAGIGSFQAWYALDLAALATQLETRWLAAVSSDTKERT